MLEFEVHDTHAHTSSDREEESKRCIYLIGMDDETLFKLDVEATAVTTTTIAA